MTSVWDNVARCTVCDMEGGCICPVIETNPNVSDEAADNDYYDYEDMRDREEREHNAREKIADKVGYAHWLEEWITESPTILTAPEPKGV